MSAVAQRPHIRKAILPPIAQEQILIQRDVVLCHTCHREARLESLSAVGTMNE